MLKRSTKCKALAAHYDLQVSSFIMISDQEHQRWIAIARADATQNKLVLAQYLTSLDEDEDAQELKKSLGLRRRPSHDRDNTERAYRSDQRVYVFACHKANVDPLQPPREFWVDYWKRLGGEPLKKEQPRRAGTVYRASYAIQCLFMEYGLPSPTRTLIHRQTLRTIARADARSPRKARPLTAHHALQLLEANNGETIRDYRNSGIYGFGINKGFRGATIVHLRLADLIFDERGVKIGIRDDKTNKTGETVFTVAAHSRDHIACLPCILKRYINALEALGITDGPLFRPIDRWGHMEVQHLTTRSVTALLRKGLAKANVPEPNSYSSHSYRHGVIETAIKSGWSIDELMLLTMHRSRRGIAPYINAIDPWYFAPRQLDLTTIRPAPRTGAGWEHVFPR